MLPSFDQDFERAYQVLRQGGLVLLPTDVGYGLVGCSERAVARIYELKGRSSSKPCVTVANQELLAEVAVLRDERYRGWLAQISANLPIAVINRVRESSLLLRSTPPEVLAQATSAGTIATFLNAGELVSALGERLRHDQQLLVGSSANLSSTGNNYALAEVPASIRSSVDLEIDHGPARYRNSGRLATTVLDLTQGTILRKGIHHAFIAASWESFQRSLREDSLALAS